MKSPTVVILSLLGILCLVLTFTHNWLFIIPAAILSGISWQILLRKK